MWDGRPAGAGSAPSPMRSSSEVKARRGPEVPAGEGAEAPGPAAPPVSGCAPGGGAVSSEPPHAARVGDGGRAAVASEVTVPQQFLPGDETWYATDSPASTYSAVFEDDGGTAYFYAFERAPW